jgi:hypothetical protein
MISSDRYRPDLRLNFGLNLRSGVNADPASNTGQNVPAPGLVDPGSHILILMWTDRAEPIGGVSERDYSKESGRLGIAAVDSSTPGGVGVPAIVVVIVAVVDKRISQEKEGSN